jgi:hypothetical protein
MNDLLVVLLSFILVSDASSMIQFPAGCGDFHKEQTCLDCSGSNPLDCGWCNQTGCMFESQRDLCKSNWYGLEYDIKVQPSTGHQLQNSVKKNTRVLTLLGKQQL